MSLQARLVASLLLAVLLAAGWWRLTAYYEARGAAQERAKWMAEAQASQERMRELQRAAELRYTVAQPVRDRFITQTIREVQHVTTHLAACPVGEPATRLLNDAARCALDPTAAGCARDGVPAAPAPAG